MDMEVLSYKYFSVNKRSKVLFRLYLIACTKVHSEVQEHQSCCKVVLLSFIIRTNKMGSVSGEIGCFL